MHLDTGCDGRLRSISWPIWPHRLRRHRQGTAWERPSVVAAHQVDGRGRACKAGTRGMMTGHAGEQALAALAPSAWT